LPIIDFHTHIYPPAIAEKATQSIRDFYDLAGGPAHGTAEELLRIGKETGIDRFVILPVSQRPDRVRSINRFTVEQAAKHDAFVPFGTIHAAMEDLTGEVAFIREHQLKGIKIHPDIQGFDIDDARLYPLYEEIEGKLPMMIHMGDKHHLHSRPEKLRRVLLDFPKLQCVGAHFGGYSMYDIAYENLHDQNCIFDLSSSLMFLKKEDARRLIRAYGTERIVFGTDYPLWHPAEELNRFLELGLTAEETDQILFKTAKTFLPDVFNL